MTTLYDIKRMDNELLTVQYIKREAALMKLMQDGCSAKNLQSISDMPAADVAPVVHGHWIEQEDGNLDTYYTCSSCKEDFDLIAGTPCENLYNYCPSCGAKMDELVEENKE